MKRRSKSTNVIESKPIRIFVFALGWVFIGLGVMGVALPLLPGTPFLLLALTCFFRTSPKMHKWMMEHPVFGKYLQNYLQGKGISKKTKLISILSMFLALIITAFLVEFDPIIICVLLLSAAIALVLITRIPTLRV